MDELLNSLERSISMENSELTLYNIGITLMTIKDNIQSDNKYLNRVKELQGQIMIRLLYV